MGIGPLPSCVDACFGVSRAGLRHCSRRAVCLWSPSPSPPHQAMVRLRSVGRLGGVDNGRVEASVEGRAGRGKRGVKRGTVDAATQGVGRSAASRLAAGSWKRREPWAMGHGRKNPTPPVSLTHSVSSFTSSQHSPSQGLSFPHAGAVAVCIHHPPICLLSLSTTSLPPRRALRSPSSSPGHIRIRIPFLPHPTATSPFLVC